MRQLTQTGTESLTHLRLKQKVAEYLNSKGYEIRFEKWLNLPNGKNYRCDVYAVNSRNPQDFYIVEVGDVQDPQKLPLLLQSYGREHILHFPYGSVFPNSYKEQLLEDVPLWRRRGLQTTFTCPYCQTIFDATLERCPKCGAFPNSEFKPILKEKKIEIIEPLYNPDLVFYNLDRLMKCTKKGDMEAKELLKKTIESGRGSGLGSWFLHVQTDKTPTPTDALGITIINVILGFLLVLPFLLFA